MNLASIVSVSGPLIPRYALAVLLGYTLGLSLSALALAM